ncbi:MAG: M48 family metallopeptidase [Steroidobacteraceae bacterium]
MRHSRRARRLTVRVFLTGRVEVVVPPRTPERVVRDFLSRHREWIEARRLRAQRERPARAAFPPAAIGLPAFDESWSLQSVPGPGRPRLVQATAGLLEVHGSPTGPVLRSLLRTWVRARATARLGPWLASLARETGLGYARMAVRRQRSRWGSCSTRGTISLNASLAFQRPAVVRYLLLHELAHTQHMNHSSRFWRLVAAHEPDWQPLDRELTAGWRRVPHWMFDDVD